MHAVRTQRGISVLSFLYVGGVYGCLSVSLLSSTSFWPGSEPSDSRFSTGVVFFSIF